jgi:drug/metabolite transporter (DMT)-like permease
MTRSHSRGVLCCLAATVSWGGMFPVMTGALAHVDPFTFTCVRITIAAAAFLLLLRAREGRGSLRLSAREGWLAWFLGSIAFVGFGFLVFLGQQLAGPRGALMASIMMATQPMLGLLVNWGLRKTRPPLVSFGFIALSFAGAVLVATDGHVEALLRQPANYGANGLIVLGALCWVVYTVGASFFPQWSPVKYTALTTGLGLSSVCLSTLALWAFGWLALPPPAAFGAVLPHLLYMALVAGFVGVLSWNVGNRILTPLNGVLFMDVVPVTAFIVSAVGGVVPTAAQVLGAGLSCAALVGNNLVLRRRAAAAPAGGAARPVLVAR